MVEVPQEARHYYRASRRPFANLSDLGQAEVDLVVDQLGVEMRRGDHRRVFGRRYMELRRRTEEKMRGLFEGAGGRPERAAPHYFVLGRSRWFEGLAPDMREVVVALADLPDQVTSVTYPDSFTAMGLAPEYALPYEPRPYHGRVYRLGDLAELISQHGLPADETSGYDGYEQRPFEAYVEIQLWSDGPVAALIDRASLAGDDPAPALIVHSTPDTTLGSDARSRP